MEATQFPAGEILFDEGDEADAAYLVQDGIVEIVIDGKVVGEVGAGRLFGEMALISAKPRAATARTKTEVTCIVVPRPVFDSILRNADAFTRALIQSLIQHVRSSNRSSDDEDDADVQFFMPQKDGSYQQHE
ncbi:MAG: cyclic nucleotide-binding domain-containing protein [Rhodospirillales bacterium]